MAGSLLIGTLLYTAPLLKNNNSPSYTYTTSITSVKENINIGKEDIKEEIVETNKNEQNVSDKKDNISSSNKPSSSNTSANKPSVSKPNTTPPKNPTPSSNNTPNKTEPAKPTEPPKKEEISKPITYKNPVTIKRSNGTILTLELEDYLIGVVSAEMPASFHSEALKAQAVAARTYALKTIESGKTLTDTVSTQAYQDNNQLKNKWGQSYL